MDERIIQLRDGHPMFFRVWPAAETKATMHINHGMTEHSERYGRFAAYLNSLGITVYAQDHRGHGYTKAEDEKGWFAEHDGWSVIVDDAWALDMLISQEYPHVPHLLFGHSMGSFLVRTLIKSHSQHYAGVIVCGTGASMGLMGKAGKLIAARNARKYGARMPDKLMEKLSFSSYGRHFPGEGQWAWLTKDREAQKAYEDDILCGFTCSSGFYVDLLTGIERANDAKAAEGISKDLPMLIISGDRDPVGAYGKGVRKVFRLYRKAGLGNVRLRLFPDDRHEILNETDSDAVMEEIGRFCLSIMEHGNE